MKSANKWDNEGIFKLLEKAERATNESGGLISSGLDECDGEVRALLLSRKKPNSPEDLSTKEEKTKSNKGSLLSTRDVGEFDGEVRALLRSREKPDSLQDLSAK
eukprot:5141068-Ditylum_brightwellii.AAC.1